MSFKFFFILLFKFLSDPFSLDGELGDKPGDRLGDKPGDFSFYFVFIVFSVLISSGVVSI